MSSLATTSWTDAPPIPLRVDDDELGQRIALALRTRRPTLDMEPLLAGRYRLEGRVSIDEHIETFDATRVSDGRWVTIEMPIEDARAEPDARERFIELARLQCRLRHPHVMYALEHGVASDGRPYLVREALDTESLAHLLAREGSVTWTRARSIALQLCNAVTAARELGLAAMDLTLEGCQRARHGRAVDDIRLAKWSSIEGMTPDERDERGAVFAISRILEELVAGRGPDAAVGSNPHVVPPPPAELGTVLARGRSLVPSARYATVEQLGLAIAAIGDDRSDQTSPPQTTYALHTTPRRRSRPIVIEQPAEITCTTAAVIVTPAKDRPVTRAQPIAKRRAAWPWIGLAAMVGACAVHVVAPEFWPGVAELARTGVDEVRDAVRSREALDLPPPTEDVAAVPVVEVETPTVEVESPPIAHAPVVAPTPIEVTIAAPVVVRSAAVPPAPPVSAPKAKAKPRPRIAKPAPAVVVAATPTPPEEAPIVDAMPEVVTDAVASPEIPEPITTSLPPPPASDPIAPEIETDPKETNQ